MSFVDLVLFMMNMVDKTMQRELNDFIKEVKKEPIKYGKSAMSKARLKISPELFIDLNEGLLEDIYEEIEDIKLHHGFRIIGVDGSTLALPNMNILKDKKQSEDIKEIYGKGSNQKGEYGATPRISILYDLENKFVLDGILSSIHSSEGFMAIEHIDKLLKYKKSIKEKYKDLLIYDRGYPSMGLIKYHYKYGLDFLMRVNSKSFKAVQEFRRSKKVDEIIEIEVTRGILNNLSKEKQHPNLKALIQELKIGDKLKIRAVKVILQNGTVEVLLTSLLSQNEYKTEIFQELYFKRWEVEIGYDVLKNIFNLENFTGLTQIAINQDFYATILTNNLCSLIMNDVMEEKVSLYNQAKKRKYLYQLNKSFSIGCMKNTLVLMFQKNVREEKIYQMIEDEILRNLLPIKPNRSFERKKHSSTKFPVSKKAGF
jgi:hypothetical protein